MSPDVAHQLAADVLGQSAARHLVDWAHFEAQKALLGEGFEVRRDFGCALKEEATGHTLSEGAIFEDTFSGRELLLRTDLFMTTEADSYGCAYLSWDLRYADEGPRQAEERNPALGFKQVYEGRGVDRDWPSFDAQEELLKSLAAPLNGPSGSEGDIAALAQSFAHSVATELTL